jgi:hypothetical protein
MSMSTPEAKPSSATSRHREGGGGTGRNGAQPHTAGCEINEPGAFALEGGVPLWSATALGNALPVPSCERKGSLPDARRSKG